MRTQSRSFEQLHRLRRRQASLATSQKAGSPHLVAAAGARPHEQPAQSSRGLSLSHRGDANSGFEPVASLHDSSWMGSHATEENFRTASQVSSFGVDYDDNMGPRPSGSPSASRTAIAVALGAYRARVLTRCFRIWCMLRSTKPTLVPHALLRPPMPSRSPTPSRSPVRSPPCSATGLRSGTLGARCRRAFETSSGSTLSASAASSSSSNPST